MSTLKIDFKKFNENINKELDVNSVDLHENVRLYTQKIKDWEDEVTLLDRHDRFDHIEIDLDCYRTEEGDYGIKYNQNIHGTSRYVLFDHQNEATRRFLSELRCFGLLADVVGSGKTYEAGQVLSELSARQDISSMLLIVPDQVLETWIKVIEMQFGLGKGQLYRVGKGIDITKDTEYENEDSKFRTPKRKSWIVTHEDFREWEEGSVDNLLFDIVVVDEAHNIQSDNNKSGNDLMYRLSKLMQTKEKANKTYCLLLSATPHDGNIADMFKLWYFIRCHGGNPKDFIDGNIWSDRFNKERSYYHDTVCHGASTVMEFINNICVEEAFKTFEEEYIDFLNWRKSNEKKNSSTISAINAYFEENGEIKKLVTGKAEKILKNEGDDSEERNNIIKKVANDYHNVLMRPIMVRQPENKVKRTKANKTVVNVYYFPIKKEYENEKYAEISGWKNESIKVDISALSEEVVCFKEVENKTGGFTEKIVVDIEGEKAIERNGEKVTVKEYLEEHIGEGVNALTQASQQFYFNSGKLLNTLMDETEYDNNNPRLPYAFKKANSFRYYSDQQFLLSPRYMENDKMFIQYLPVKNDDESVFKSKIDTLIKIIEHNPGKRVIVFFDYSKPKKKDEDVPSKVEKALKKSYSDRLIIGTDNKIDQTKKEFDEKSDAILIVKKEFFTEGANFQAGHIIVNFEVTPNPLSMEQRTGRIFRIGQSHDMLIYSLADMRELEGYVLSYYSRIGLIQSNSGDAAIIAGCNNDDMVVLRCPACARVSLLSKKDYKEMLGNPQKSERLYCNQTDKCRRDKGEYGTLMAEIPTIDCKCDDQDCRKIIQREGGSGRYFCIRGDGEGTYLNTGKKGDRSFYCSKICSIKHCSRFTANENEKSGRKLFCPALKRSLESATLTEIAITCNNCKNNKICMGRGCALTISDMKESIKACASCEYSTCLPKPHFIEFDGEWTADCPNCKANGRNGKLKPIRSKTFETYIRNAYKFDGDTSAFCNMLKEESTKVDFIRKVLSNDEEEGRTE